MRIFNPSNLVSQPRIFILCFFIGSFIWLFNELNSTSDTTVKYPLVFEYENKSDYVVLEPLPDFIDISINGTGWNLLRNIFQINIKKAIYTVNKPSQTKFILSPILTPMISESLENVKLNYIVGDSIFLNIDDLINKKVHLNIDSTLIDLENNYKIISPLKLSNNQVTFYGPKSLINNISDTLNLDLDIKAIKNDFNESINIIKNKNRFINSDPSSINLQFEVSEFIENKIDINHSYVEDDYYLDTIFTISYMIQNGMKLNLDDSFKINLIRDDNILLPSLLIIPEGIEIVSIFPEKIIMK